MLDYKPMKTRSKDKFFRRSVTKKPNHNCFPCDMTGFNNIKPTLIGCVRFRTIIGCQKLEITLTENKNKAILDIETQNEHCSIKVTVC